MDGHWYSVQFADAFTNVAATLSSRTVGSVGGWYLVAHQRLAGRAPARLMRTSSASRRRSSGCRFASPPTPEDAADFHARYQSQFKLLPLDVYARNPKAAALANPQPQPGAQRHRSARPPRCAARSTRSASSTSGCASSRRRPAKRRCSRSSTAPASGRASRSSPRGSRRRSWRACAPPRARRRRRSASCAPAARPAERLELHAARARRLRQRLPAARGRRRERARREPAGRDRDGARSADGDGRALDGRNDYVIRFEARRAAAGDGGLDASPPTTPRRGC